MGRILAIDYGSVRLGLALSDETKTIAYPLAYVSAQEKQQVLGLIREQEVEEILLGLPKGLGGQDTKMTEEVRGFEEWLAKTTGCPVRLIDERLSSKEAERELHGMGNRASAARELIDSLVAQKMLENYLATKRK